MLQPVQTHKAEESAAHISEAQKAEYASSLKSASFDPSLIPVSLWQFKSKNSNRSNFYFELPALGFDAIEQLKNSGSGSKKLSCTILGNILRCVMVHCPRVLLPMLLILSQEVAPAYMGCELGIGENALLKTVCNVYGRSEAQIQTGLRLCGDLGQIAFENKRSLNMLMVPPRLHIEGIFKTAQAMAKINGHRSQDRKRELLQKLMIGAVGLESKYIVRFFEKSLRIGVQKPTIFNSIIRMILLSPVKKLPLSGDAFEACVRDLLECGITDLVLDYCEANFSSLPQPAVREGYASYSLDVSNLEALVSQNEELVRLCFSRVPNIALITFYLLHGINVNDLVDLCKIQYGVPISPMLAKAAKGYFQVEQGVNNSEFRAEFKYDGERIQIHRVSDVEVYLFSRNMERLNDKYPDVVQAVKNKLKHQCILDAEIVAVNPDGSLESFQKLAARKRKDVKIEDVDGTAKLFVFDCLKFDTEDVLDLSLRERLTFLNKLRICQSPSILNVHNDDTVETANVSEESSTENTAKRVRVDGESPGKTGMSIVQATGHNLSNIENLEELMNNAVGSMTEGLMIKILDGKGATYEPARRNTNWMKLKKDYIDKLGDSVDLAVIGALYGKGKRSGKYGCFLLAVYDEADEAYRSTCKVATGFTDPDLISLYEQLKETEIPHKPDFYHTGISVDVWFWPTLVFEIKAADLQISPVHKACEGILNTKGIGLRFPRFLRVRVDKKPCDSTDSERIHDMYKDQFLDMQAAEDDPFEF